MTGRLLLAGYRSRPTPTEKARRDLVTEFDLKSEALIVERLSARTPELGLVAEEHGGTEQARSWFCDPLDGLEDVCQVVSKALLIAAHTGRASASTMARNLSGKALGVSTSTVTPSSLPSS